MPRDSAGQSTKSRNAPVNGRLTISFFVSPNSTGWTPPSGSTICAVIRAATGFPPAVAWTVYDHLTPIRGLCVGRGERDLHRRLAAVGDGRDRPGKDRDQRRPQQTNGHAGALRRAPR